MLQYHMVITTVQQKSLLCIRHTDRIVFLQILQEPESRKRSLSEYTLHTSRHELESIKKNPSKTLFWHQF